MKSGCQKILLCSTTERKKAVVSLDSMWIQFIFIPQLTQFLSVYHIIEPPLRYWACLSNLWLLIKMPYAQKIDYGEILQGEWCYCKEEKANYKGTIFGSWSFYYPIESSVLRTDPFYIDVRRANILKGDIWVRQKDLSCVWGIAWLCLTSRSS